MAEPIPTTSTAPFIEQAFLMYNLAKLAPIHNKRHLQEGFYERLDLFKGNPSLFINSILYQDFVKDKQILNLRPEQISILRPLIRFYKQVFREGTNEVEDEFEIEFPINPQFFDDGKKAEFYSVREFNVESQGKTNYVPDRTMLADLQLNLSSLNCLVRNRISQSKKTGKYYTYSLLELFSGDMKRAAGEKTPPSIDSIGEIAPVNLSEEQQKKNNLKAQLRVEIGWKLDESAGIPDVFKNNDKQPNNQKIYAAVKRARMSFLLYHHGNQIQILENASIAISGKYTAAIDFLTRKVQASPFTSPELIEQLVKITNQTSSPSEDPSQAVGTAKSDAELKALQETYNQQALESLLKTLLEGDQTRKRSQIYQTWISRTAMDHFAVYKGAPPDDNVGPPLPAHLATREFDPETQSDPNAPPIDFPQLKWDLLVANSNGIEYPYFKVIQTDEESLDYDLENDENPIIVDAQGQEYYHLKWFYLGDLLEIMMKNSFNGSSEDTKLAASYGANFSKRIKLILTDIEVIDHSDSNLRKIRLNLAHVPVSLRAFKKFFYEEVITKSQPHEVTIDDFIKLLTNKFIQDIFLNSFESYDNIRKQPNFSVRYTTLNKFTSTPDVDYFTPNGDVFTTSMISKNNSPMDPSLIESSNSFYYMVIYQHAFDASQLTGDEMQDALKGIPHVYMSSNQGLVKKANLTQQEIPGLKETRIIQSPSNPANIFRNLYNVSLQMYGSSLFNVGSYFYLNPVSLGSLLGNPSNSNSYANLLGIGGYHLALSVKLKIKQGEFLCEVDAGHESTGAPNSPRDQSVYPEPPAEGITDDTTLPEQDTAPPDLSQSEQ